MPGEFSLTDAEKELFSRFSEDKAQTNNAVSQQEAKYDAFESLMGAGRILNDIKSKISLSFNGQALVLCDASNSKDVLVAVSRFVSHTNKVPVIVLLNYNYKTIQDALKGGNFFGEYIIIDAVSKSVAQIDDFENVTFVDSLRDLTQLQIKVLKMIEKRKDVVFVFDSLRVLELYHKEDVVFKFVYSLTKILHKNNCSSFFISAKMDVSNKIKQFFDESIELKKYI